MGGPQAVIQGKIIQTSSKPKREKRAEIDKLEKEFIKSHKKYTSYTSLAQLDTAHLPLNLALTTEAEKSLRWTRVRFYARKDKIGPSLAEKLPPKLLHFILLF